MDYWRECIESAFDEAGIVATPEQVCSVVDYVSGGHENYGMAFGHDAIPNPIQSELDTTKAALKAEREKVHCQRCNGRGRIFIQGPSH
ncbi:hypothetical protein LCGC14_1179940, partial [marine sediment metagenome]